MSGTDLLCQVGAPWQPFPQQAPHACPVAHQCADIEAAAEIDAGTVHQHRAHGLFTPQAPLDVDDGFEQGQVQGIVFLRPVEADPGHPTVDLQSNALRHFAFLSILGHA
ncbi:MAG: hypothetical protein RQ826_06510 [Xanthomonadales bacterium]|nr:hypothetical protein [Xanthomonadales bacterium]